VQVDGLLAEQVDQNVERRQRPPSSVSGVIA
jgi:hypothetical protein